MKKITTIFLMFVSVFCFAEAFSKAKFSDLHKNTRNQLPKYCYEAQISEESNTNHCTFGARYLIKDLKETRKTNIDAFIEKFSKKLNKDRIAAIKIQYYFMAGLVAESKELALTLKNKSNYYKQVIYPFVQSKDYDMIWNISSEMLTKVGGMDSPKTAFLVINNMFKYKPNSISKEEQIKLLEILSEKYPTPGTDFAKWKEFMGFVGYKYKTLTGKQLYNIK